MLTLRKTLLGMGRVPHCELCGSFLKKVCSFVYFRKSNNYELYTQDARAEMINEHHNGHPVLDHKMWMFKPLR